MVTIAAFLIGLALLLSTSAPAATIVGTPRNDVIRGTAKSDKLNGKAGNDKLYGLGGNDTLVGGPGGDTLVGGAGADKLQCGPGRDTAIADSKDKVSADCETVRGAVLPSISIADASVAEGNSGTTPLSFEMKLSSPVTWKTSVSYATADGTASAGSDYASAAGRVTFAPGKTTKTIDVQVDGDTVIEPGETLTISLSGAVNATIAKGSATGTISNDDQQNTEWHRLSGDKSNTAPEHERLQCVESLTWTCLYSKVPEPGLNFQWNGQQETFTGSLTPRGQWTCPTWFPSTICANVDRVAQGVGTWGPPGNFSLRQDLIVTKTGNHEQLYNYWVGRFVCPWYSTFNEALAANPFPLPFNGTNWPAQDCVSTP